MRDIYEKVGRIISEVLLYSSFIDTVEKPQFYNDSVVIVFYDTNHTQKRIELDFKTLANLYDHKLDKKILEIIGALNGQ